MMGKKKKLLITGAAGTIGSALRKHLKDRYDFRLLCHKTIPDDLDASEELVVSDISNFEAMVEACDGVDAIAHLAIFNRWRGMTRSQLAQLTFDIDMKGTYNLFEAARINNVKTMVFASTNHVTG
ncbi:MAG: NAD(P)-dependent oxidoreductase, partial [Candidatus Latescibacteria bacterium]|nr:NAD(P)-dependent oxidoreductase [Candidatus Latescibacterota bacterium]